MHSKKKTSQKLVGKIHLIDLSKNQMKEYFPDVSIPTYDTMSITVGGTEVGYLCLEDSNVDVCMIHIHILDDHRTPSTFKAITKYVRPIISKYLKGKGKSILITGCDYDDTKIHNLIRLFGFDLKPYYIGTMTL
jgi:mannitol-1-phosphate/altronate dehydrogenase